MRNVQKYTTELRLWKVNNTYYKRIQPMAKAKAQSTTVLVKSKTKRPGVHSKKNTSALKTSKNYKKLYNGQG